VHPEAEEAAVAAQDVLHRSPTLYGLDRHTWTLVSLQQVLPWMACVSVPGICRLLKRLGVSYKRGRQHIHSPDPAYDRKLAQISLARQLAQQAPGEVVFLYEDEFTAYLRP
jgi:hypothetical protein